jgi:hypothetical protein
MHSLAMRVEFLDGLYWIEAPWLRQAVTAPTFEAAYELALARYRSRG